MTTFHALRALRIRMLLRRTVRSAAPRMTCDALVTALITLLRAGSTLADACAHIRGQGSASAILDEYSVRALVRDTVSEAPIDAQSDVPRARMPPDASLGTTAALMPGISAQHSGRESFTSQLYAVCKLSEISGCSAVQCLEILHEELQRSRERARRKADAVAVAVMTVRVLFALPLGTLLLGELTGTHALSFLLTTRVGWVCLAVTGACYACGGAWTSALLRSFEKATRPRLGYGAGARVLTRNHDEERSVR